MPKRELKDRFCEVVKATGGQQTDYFDTVVHGLCLRVSPAGTRTFYLIYTKATDGRRARMRLGTYPELGLKDARQKARDARGAVGEGRDPLAEKRARDAGQTVRDLVENYITRHAAEKRSGNAIARRLRKNVSGYDAEGKKLENRSTGCIGDVKLAELHKRDITKALDAVTDRGAGTEANRVFEDVRAMVRWARSRGDLDTNLAEGMRRPTETTERERVLTDDEIRTMWATLAKADMRESTRRILRLCLVTAQRVGEVAGMTRTEIDLDQAVWTIPAARAKNGREHVVPLSEMAIGIIREQIAEVGRLARRKNRAVPQWVFPARGSRAAVGAPVIPKAVRAHEWGIAHWTPHDLRRTAATKMETLGTSPFIIGHVLNHVSETKATITSRVYAHHRYEKEKREALTLWAEHLAGIVAGGAKVVPLRAVG